MGITIVWCTVEKRKIHKFIINLFTYMSSLFCAILLISYVLTTSSSICVRLHDLFLLILIISTTWTCSPSYTKWNILKAQKVQHINLINEEKWIWIDRYLHIDLFLIKNVIIEMNSIHIKETKSTIAMNFYLTNYSVLSFIMFYLSFHRVRNIIIDVHPARITVKSKHRF